MKNYISLILIGITINCACAQTKHEWKVTLKVMDDIGQTVADANASIGYYTNRTGASIKGLTDTNGIFTASHPSYGGELGFAVEKAGYYTTRESYVLGFTYDPVKWNPTQKIVLKKIGNPIPMYAKRIEGGPPVFNESVGYDLMVGDWVIPHGKGQIADIIFTGKLDQKAKNDFDYTLIVSFPKPGDGIQEFDLSSTDKASGLHSSHEAPVDGFKPQVVRTMSRHPGGGTKEDMNDPNRNYFFRVRTVLDENGNIKSTLYGKIYGDFMQFHYYLNPTPNSRNVEFDPKRNLSKNLSDMEGVSEP